MLGIVLIALLSGLAKTGSLRTASRGLGDSACWPSSWWCPWCSASSPCRACSIVALPQRRDAAHHTVALCFGFTLLTVKLGFSLALGAFLIGALVAEARECTASSP